MVERTQQQPQYLRGVLSERDLALDSGAAGRARDTLKEQSWRLGISPCRDSQAEAQAAQRDILCPLAVLGAF